MAFDFSTLVTDRSQADLDTLRALLAVPLEDWTAEQLAEFNRALSKGAYNYTDLNRVTACMDYLNEVLTGLGYETGYQRIAVPHQDAGGRLPSGYTELQYIQSTGTQWIDTGITPTQDYTLYTKVAFLGSSGTNVLGTRNSSNDTTNRFGIISFGSSALFGAFYGTNSVTGKAVDQTPHEFSIGPDGFTMDEKTVSVQQTNFSCSYPIILFGFNNGANGIVGAEEKVYSCKIYSDGQLVRDFIPCINPDGIIGLYDKENAIFYQNSGNGNFVKGPELVTLPSEYKQLEYIQSTGTQRINTGIKPDGNTRATVDIQISDAQTTEGHLFSVTGNKYFVVSFNPQLTAWWRTRHGSSVLTSFPASANTRGRCIVDKNQNITTVNEEIVTLPEADFSLNYNMNLFCRNARGQFNAFLSAKLYSCQIYQAGELVRNFVPCLSPTGDVGLYDLCENKFYGNSGTGVFIGGPEIVTPDPEPPPDPYTWYESDVPTSSLLSAYLANVGNLKDTLILPTGTPAVPDDMEGLTQTEANNIEKILEIINEYLVSLQKISLRCGHAICGNNFYFAN